MLNRCCPGCECTCRLFTLILATSGLVFSVLTAASCEFFEYDNGFAEWLPEDKAEGTVGVWQGDIDHESGCKTYPDGADLDTYMIMAQYCSAIAVGCGAMALLLYTLEWRCCKFCGSTTMIHFFLFAAYASQGLTFCIFGTEKFCLETGRSCSLGLGGIYCLVAFSTYVVASCAICFSPKPASNDDPGGLKREWSDSEEPLKNVSLPSWKTVDRMN